MKKLIILISIIIILFIIFIIFYNIPKNYETKYELENFTIIEKYNKEQNYYNFNIKNKSYEFSFLSEFKYKTKRKLITDLEIIKDDNYYCIIPKIENEKTYPLCYEDDKLISYNLINSDKLTDAYSNEIKELNENYENINIYNYEEQTYLLWNYSEFFYLNKNETKTIKLFDKEIYNLNIAGTVNNYLIVADYNSNHTFNKIYIIDMESGKLDEWKLDEDISFDSYIMGSVDKSIYLFDTKNKTQYELVPHKKKMRIVSDNKNGIVFDKEWIDISLNKLANEEYIFNYDNLYNYNYEDNLLYFKIKETNDYTQLTNKQRELKIIYQNNDTLYYLEKDILYSFNPYIGELKLLQNFEWNFNNNKMIYIYNSLT